MRLGLVALLALAACSPDPDEPGGTGGSAGAPVTGPVVVHPAQFLGEGQALRPLADGDPFDLWSASQGGHVARVAAQIEGIGGDTISLHARFTDTVTGEIVAEETRTVLVRPVTGSDTLKENDTRLSSQMTHVPLCPDYLPYDVVGHEMQLTVDVTELYTQPARKGSASVRVTPRCGALAESVGLCTCECSANYTLGKCGVPK